MLGRLRMSITECILAYEALSIRVFRPRRQRNSILSLVSDMFSSRFDSDALVHAVEDMLQRVRERRDARLIDRTDAPCKVFVKPKLPVLTRKYMLIPCYKIRDCRNTTRSGTANALAPNLPPGRRIPAGSLNSTGLPRCACGIGARGALCHIGSRIQLR